MSGFHGGQNNSVGMLSTNKLVDLDAISGLVRAFCETLPDCELMGTTSDSRSAHRQASANPDHAQYSILAMWDPVKQVPCVGMLQSSFLVILWRL